MRKALLENLLMPASSAVTPFKSWQYFEQMCRAEYEPLQRQRMQRMALIRELLVHSYREVDLYRQALDRAQVDPVEVSYPQSFTRVPITSKNDLRAGFPERQLARSYRRRALRWSNTSGTTGKPLLLIQDIGDISWKYASILRSRRVAGVDPMAAQARITPNECQPCLPGGDSPGRVLPLPGAFGGSDRRAGLFVFLERSVLNPFFHRRLMLDPLWTGPQPTCSVDYDAWLTKVNDFRPEVLSLYPLYAAILAKHIRRTGVTPPRVRGIIDFSGGIVTPRMRTLIESVFGVRSAQSCGGCEFARYAASCPEDPDRMHLAEDYCYVESVRPDGEHASPRELGNLIVTSLHSRAMPIVRLEPGDVGVITEEPCRCGRRSRRLEHHGRVQALIRNQEGRWVTAREVWDAVLPLRGVEMFQLVQQKPDRYLLRVVPEPDTKLDEAALDAALLDLLGRQATVTRELTPGIRPERSGKLQLVKSCTFQDFRVQSARHRDVPVN